MNLDIEQIKNLTARGNKYYRIVDVINTYAPEIKWNGEKAEVYLNIGNDREGYSSKEWIIKFIDENKPKELSNFDKMLKGIMNVPKPLLMLLSIFR